MRPAATTPKYNTATTNALGGCMKTGKDKLPIGHLMPVTTSRVSPLLGFRVVRRYRLPRA